ncbi:uncharacterized protein BYT42DRAFT_417975 [Radiomyces spectabilis]|uniref:uncharacterized protein n=1 Tax=Radiomyces spectabilis TaxID=64574 RepID=UPI00221E50F6|nr:uncharacterized protein BYT42DRAFT_417975 [Radiomyces spectabilis]KAI8374742.1 hypothetical protein BYT42DRAFT_417975 [Radiomyces spectabilis]
MASFASVKPPFAYDPTCKPTKSILKHRGTSQGTATSWLSRLSLNDLTATSPTAAPLTQRSSLGFFNFRRNVQVSPPTTTPPDASLPSSPDNPALKHASLDELAPEELKRVRFPVDHLTTEFYPYGPSPLANEDDTSRSEKENTQPPSSIKCQTPQELLTVYETACRNKEEPTLDKLVTMLITCQHMDHLTTIDLSNQAIYRRSAEPLADLLSLDFRLKKLILNNCALEDDVIKILLHGLLLKDQLEELSLANNKKIRGAGFKYIAIYTKTSTALRKLDLSFTTPDKKSIQHLAHGIESSSLHTLRMNSCSLRPPQLEVLANGIRQSRSLRHVSLCDNRITHQGALWIGVMLRDYDGHVFSQGLTELALDHNDIRQGIQYIAQALRRNQSLRSLSLQDCKLDSKGCALIGEALKYNQSLENLNISFNGLNAPSIEGIQALKRALYVNRSLKELSLAASGLGSEAAVELAESLPENKALVRLDLSKNEAMDLAGLLALAAGVRINYSIVFLDVSVPVSVLQKNA